MPMRQISQRILGTSNPATRGPLGLFRSEVLQSGSPSTLGKLFADLREVNRGQLIGEDPMRQLQGTRLTVDRSQGEGIWELYNLGQDLFVVAADGMFDTDRVETVPGEGLIEFHLRLSGTLDMMTSGSSQTLTVTGPRLVMMYQPPGVDVFERVRSKLQDTCVSLYCRPQRIDDLMRLGGISHSWLTEEISLHRDAVVWLRECELSPTLRYIGTSLLKNPYSSGIRLLNAEAKALELLCYVLACRHDGTAPSTSARATLSESRQLDAARRLLAANLSVPMRIRDIARAVGMSESKLKRSFKARFDMTVFDYGLECRMRRAFELLSCDHVPVGHAAHAVGYRHQSSFAAAFQDFFGFPPSKARSGMP